MVKLTKLQTPEVSVYGMLMCCEEKPIWCEKTEPQTVTVISLGGGKVCLRVPNL